MSYTITSTYALDPSYAGASLRAQLYNSSNAAVGSPISTGFYERAGAQGIFAHSMSVPDDHAGWCDVYDNAEPSVVLVSVPINPRELEYGDAKVSGVPSSILSAALTEPSGVFAWAGATVGSVLQWLAALARNKMTQTATTTKLRNNADNADIASSTVSDDGTTFTRGGWN